MPNFSEAGAVTGEVAFDSLGKAAHVDAATLRGRSRSEFVYEALRTAIREGRFGHGERIREEGIARSLGVSRTPVREALQRLQERGMLQMAPGRGLVTVELSRHGHDAVATSKRAMAFLREASRGTPTSS